MCMQTVAAPVRSHRRVRCRPPGARRSGDSARVLVQILRRSAGRSAADPIAGRSRIASAVANPRQAASGCRLADRSTSAQYTSRHGGPGARQQHEPATGPCGIAALPAAPAVSGRSALVARRSGAPNGRPVGHPQAPARGLHRLVESPRRQRRLTSTGSSQGAVPGRRARDCRATCCRTACSLVVAAALEIAK